MISTLSSLFSNSPKSVSNWRKEKRPIIQLIDKYFTKEDLQEFLENGRISRLDEADFIQKEVFQLNMLKYFQSFTATPLYSSNHIFIIFYFRFIKELYKASKGMETIDTFLFNANFYLANFNQLLNTFLVSHSISQSYENQSEIFHEIYILQKYFVIFDNWDSYMLLFLRKCIDNGFKNLFNPHDEDNKKAEAFYHICGFIVFTDNKYKDLTDLKKINFINNKYKNYQKLPLSSDSIDTILDKLFS